MTIFVISLKCTFKVNIKHLIGMLIIKIFEIEYIHDSNTMSNFTID